MALIIFVWIYIFIMMHHLNSMWALMMEHNEYKNLSELQSSPLNRVTLVPEHYDPIKRNLGVGPIKRSELILFLWFCSWPSDPINRGPSLTVTR